MKRANDARCSQNMASYRANHFTELESLSADMRDIDSIEQEEVMMSLSCGWRTRPTVPNEAEAGTVRIGKSSFDGRILTLQSFGKGAADPPNQGRLKHRSRKGTLA